MKVIIESPYAGNIEKNVEYAKKCMKDSFERGEAPYLSHLLYPLVLNDNITKERNLGIMAGLEWGKCADKTVVYTDLGISKGMEYGIENAIKNNRPIEYRKLFK